MSIKCKCFRQHKSSLFWILLKKKAFLASFNLAILSRSRTFSGKRSSVTVEIVGKKRMCLWPLLGPERGQGSNWGLLLGLVTQLLITLAAIILTTDISVSTGRHKKWFVSNHPHRYTGCHKETGQKNIYRIHVLSCKMWGQNLEQKAR